MAYSFGSPAGLHDPVPRGYRHSVAATSDSTWVLVAGQYGSDANGEVMSADFADQVAQAFRNVGTALAEHGLTLGDVVQLRTYVVDHDVTKLGPLGEMVGEIWGAKPPTQTLVGVSALATPDILFEVEAMAIRP